MLICKFSCWLVIKPGWQVGRPCQPYVYRIFIPVFSTASSALWLASSNMRYILGMHDILTDSVMLW